MTVPSPEEQARNTAILGPSYQNLMGRYGSDRATQWQVVALGLTAQGFVLAAASQVVGRPVTAILLSLVILIIGAATIVSSLRFDMFTALDRNLLDEYEKVLLVHPFECLRLRHSEHSELSAALQRKNYPPPMVSCPEKRAKRVERFVMLRIARAFGSKRWWVVVVLEFVISAAGVAISILGIIGL